MKLKICGMKYCDNIRAVAQLKPDYMGFIYYQKSPRNFQGNIPEICSSIKKTAVFVNQNIEDILRLLSEHNFQVIQLHGSESVAYIQKLKSMIPDVEVIKVFGIKDEFDFSILSDYEADVNYFLFDTKGKYKGGNGTSFNWHILQKYHSSTPYFLSGGIGLDSISDLQKFVRSEASKRCIGVDINSKFELKPGLKSIQQISLFQEQFTHINSI